ncbi:MAG: hypothetical protein WC208_15305 [Gallionella sp.]|jgi:hypothetical protein
MGITNKFLGKTVAVSMQSLNLEQGTTECNGTAEVTFTHGLGVIPDVFWCAGASTGSFATYFKAVPTAVGGTLYATGSCTVYWNVGKTIGK